MKLPKTYEPTVYEADIYRLWEESGSFKPKPAKTESDVFSIVMPPPNANDNLHVGHALMAALEDIVVRYQRLRGKSTVYIPGADHAGFETWVVYEKLLAKQGKTRFDYTREELYRQVWDFVQMNKGVFDKQLRAVGVSCDWSRFTFTLDKKVVDQAYRLFKQMWHDKLIYRGERLVNYCTFHGTSFADIEVVYKKQRGKLWYIKYPLTDRSGELVVATTRPETMLGDTAVAINPKDKRYQKYLGKTIKLPITNREVPIIADDMVDVAYGTGIVKITPAHDFNDYEVSMRHSLPTITVISTEGKMSDTDSVPEKYRGVRIEEARKMVVQELDDLGVLEKTENISHSVGHCYKCDTVIEPLLRDQWFVSMKPLAARAIDQLKNKAIKFYPSSKLNQCITYLENIKDWNISRQIAWGIPIPAFQNVDRPDDWIYDERVDTETIELNGQTYRRDPDVFDTWFSSGQWPYVTLDFPDSKDYKTYYPLSLMETGGDILYQWVCRMIMLGLYATDKIPFKDVYIHSTVLSKDGAKMSKSIGNVVNPMRFIEEFGSDATRMGIIAGRVAGVSRSFDERKIVDARNFCNKLWNIARFIEDKVGDEHRLRLAPKPVTSADRWVISILAKASQEIAKDLDNYRFNDAYEKIYHLAWDQFADWYIEASKNSTNKSVLAYGLDTILKLAHPFAPFLTETIWQTLKWEAESFLISSDWPKLTVNDSKANSEFEKVIKVVTEIRLVKSILNTKTKFNFYYQASPFFEENAKVIQSLAGLAAFSKATAPSGLRLTSISEDCWLELDEELLSRLKSELKQQIEDQQVAVDLLRKRLANKNYVDRAPKNIVEDSKQQLETTLSQLKKSEDQYKLFFK